MKNKRQRHIPIVSIFVFQLLLILFMVIVQIEFVLAIKYNDIFIFISIINSFLLLSNIVVLILSLTILWNRPLIFTNEYIIDRRNKKTITYRWEEIKDIILITRFAGRYYRVKIVYGNDKILLFEPNCFINKSFINFSSNEEAKEIYRITLNIKDNL